MTSAFRYADEHRAEFLHELKDFVRIPSISTLPERAGDVKQAAEWVAAQLRAIGLTTVEVYQTDGHPLVYGAWLGASGATTILIYGHYDVQPVDPENEWDTPPFEPTERNGNLYARGSCDDKGQVFANIKAIQALMHIYGGKLPFNVKFLVEGEEEVASINLEDFIDTHHDLLSSDVAVISDTAMISLDQPSIVYGLRGMTYMELEVHGPRKDLHSGSFGGAVHNPAQALCEIVAALHNPDGSIAVKGFYDKVRPISQTEHDALAKIAKTEADWRAETGVPQSWGESMYSLRERTGARPTLEVNGVVGGWTGVGSKTVLPAKALAKISCRLVPDQDPYEILEVVRAQVQSITPPTVTSEVRLLSTGYPAVVPIDSPAMEAVVAAFERGFGKKPVFLREGGSIPVVAKLQKDFGMPVLLAGYGLPDDGAHGPNEKFNLECFYRGIQTSIELFERLSKLPVSDLGKSVTKN